MALPLRRRRNDRSRGQSLAEFALVFPFFLVILFGVIEFAFVFNAYLSIDFATRDAALAAVEAGNETGADCSILRAVERSIAAPADKGSITQVRIFKASTTGAMLVPKNVYTRTGSTPCQDGLGSVPYSASSTTYPESSRCNVLAGCGPGSLTVDTIGVEITYTYTWKTPLARLLPTAGPGYTMIKANAMRMEPVL